MKQLIKISILCGLIFSLTCSCTKDNVENTPIQNFYYDGCKSENLKSSTLEYIEYKVVNDHYLSLKHVNAEFNCCPEEIVVSVSIEDDKIIYTSNHKTNGCYCTCLFDTYCEIGPIENTEYIIEINTYGIDIPIQFTIDLGETTEGTFAIERDENN